MVFFGFSVADLSAAGVSAIVSLVAVAAASVLRFAAFAIAVELGNGADIFTKRLFSGEFRKGYVYFYLIFLTDDGAGDCDVRRAHSLLSGKYLDQLN